MPIVIPNLFDSSAAYLISFHQGSVQAITSGVGSLSIGAPQGLVMSARLMVVVELKPSSFKASRSLVIPFLLTLAPIHIHNTPGFADSGGFKNSCSGPATVVLDGDFFTGCAAERNAEKIKISDSGKR